MVVEVGHLSRATLLILATVLSSLAVTNSRVCLGDRLTYNCTVMGNFGGATIWRGVALRDCGNVENDIVLLHSMFTSPGGAYSECNNGDIVGRSLGVEGSYYTSQLNVKVTPDIIGMNITCFFDGSSETIQLSATIFNTSGPYAPLPPPKNVLVSAVNINSRALAFTWSPVAPDCTCPSLHYNILSSNCGSCPTTTNETTVTCTDVPTDGSMCTFAVQTVVCGDIVGNLSDSIKFTITTDDNHISVQQKGNSGYVATITTTSLFATLLFLWVIVSTTVIIVLARKARVKILGDYELPSTARTSTNIKEKETKLSAIDTRDNAAYGLNVFK